MGEISTTDNMAEYITFAQNHAIMCAVFVIVLVALIYTQIRIWMARIPKVSTIMANTKINREDGVFVDVRNSQHFNQAHIANSVNITLQEIKDGKLNRIESYKNKPIILVGRDKYDNDCFNSAVSLKKQGYTQIFNLDGGINQWSLENLPLSNKK